MKYFFIGISLLLAGLESYCQNYTDSILVLSFEEAKGRLLKENLQLVASHYQIDIAEAQVAQARLWNNPYLIWNQDLYSVELNQYFNYNNQRLIQIEQVFSVAGKYSNSIKLAKLDVELNKLIFSDVMRSLMFDLTENYTDLVALQSKEQIYQTTLTQYETIVKAAEQQQKVGTIAGNEVIRLRSEAKAIQAEALQNKSEIETTMAQLRILLNLSDYVRITTQSRQIQSDIPENIANLISLASENRADFKISQVQIEYEKQNLKLQRSLAVPDIKLAYQPHDKGSNYVRPYSGLNFEMPLPFFNRNQGEINAAKSRIEKSKAELQFKVNSLQNEVIAAYNQVIITKTGLEGYATSFFNDLEELNNNSYKNYNKRTISLLEFIDQQRIYIQNKLQIIELQNTYLKAVNRLNFNIGKDVIY